MNTSWPGLSRPEGRRPGRRGQYPSGRSRACLPLQADFGSDTARSRKTEATASVRPARCMRTKPSFPAISPSTTRSAHFWRGRHRRSIVVMLAPEERVGIERLAASEHVDGGRVSLSLGHHPMLDANGFTREPIRPARDVACGENSWRLISRNGIDDKSAVNFEAGGFRKTEPRRTPSPATMRSACRTLPPLSVTRLPSRLLAVSRQWKTTPCSSWIDFTRRLNFEPQDFLHRPLFRGDDIDLDVARAQRRRDFEADEARAEHDDPPRRLCSFDDRPDPLATERQHVGRLGAGQGRGTPARRRSRAAADRTERRRRWQA